MENIMKRILALVLALVIVFGMAPLAELAKVELPDWLKFGQVEASAVDENFDESELTDNMKVNALADMYTGRVSSGIAAGNYTYMLNSFEGPYRTMSVELKNDPWFTGNAAAFNFLSWTPSEMQANPAYYYELVVLDILNKSSQSYSATTEFNNDAMGITVEIGKEVAESVQTSYSDLANIAPDAISSSCYQSLAEKYVLDENVITGIGDAVGVVNNAKDFAEHLAAYVKVKKTNDNTIAVLSQMRDRTSNTKMVYALDSVINACRSNEDFIIHCVTETIEATAVQVLSFTLDKMIEYSLDAMGLWILSVGQSIGTISANLLFSTEETISQYKTMCVITEFEDLLRSTVNNFNNTYRSTPTLANAYNVIAGANLVYDTIDYGMNSADHFANVVYSENLWSSLFGPLGLNNNAQALANWSEAINSLRNEIANSKAYFCQDMMIFWLENYWDEYAGFFNGTNNYAAPVMSTMSTNADGTIIIQEYITNGDGTIYSPHKIYNKDDLVEYTIDSAGKYYKQMNDIAMSSLNWAPIANFGGFYDGKGYAISGLTIISLGGTYGGLFGNTLSSATIKNLGITDVNISVAVTGNSIGALAGTNLGKIEYCYSTGSIVSSSTGSGKLGGLVGFNGSDNGYSQNPLIYDCYSTVSVKVANSTSAYVGGLVGYNGYYNSNVMGKIKRCYAVGQASTSSSYAGGVVGKNDGLTRFNYYDCTTTKMGDLGKGFSITTSEMKTASTFSGWDFDNVWAISPSVNNGYPYLSYIGNRETTEIEGSGTIASPYVVTNERQLVAIEDEEFNNAKTAYYVMTNDITITAPYWTPITNFNGSFDGQGHKADSLTIKQNTFGINGDVGFFASIATNGKVQKLGLTNFSSIVTGINIGALAGTNLGKIEYCYSTGSIVSSSTGSGRLGGLVGINGSDNGFFQNPLIYDCYSTVSVKVTNSTSAYVGGLVGYNGYYNSNVMGEIKRCYAAGQITTSSSDSGGLLGKNVSGIVDSSYYDKTTSDKLDTGKGTPLTTNQMKVSSYFNGWDFDSVWQQDSTHNSGYPYLRAFEYGIEEPTYYATSINIASQPNRLVYEIGDQLDITGMVVTATYSNGATEILTEYSISGFSSVSAGQVAVILSYEELTVSFNVMVYDVVPVTVKLNTAGYKMSIGSTYSLVAVITPADAVFNDLTWESLDERVATVDSAGLITAISAGETIVTATTKHGNWDYCLIEVTENGSSGSDVNGITLNTNSVKLFIDGAYQLSAVVIPVNAANKNIIWSSTDANIATVDENGFVNAVGVGATVVIAETEDGGYKDYCLVKVSGLVVKENSSAVIDMDNKVIYGLTTGIDSVDDYITVANSDCLIDYEVTSKGFGTNTILNVIMDDEIVETYKIIIYGDVNGDGIIDTADSDMIVDIGNYVLPQWDPVTDAAYIKACDLFRDGIIDENDCVVLKDVQNYTLNLDQTTGIASPG